MNQESDSPGFGPVSADERWIDAALSEHARLGRDADEELVYRILQGTVRRPARVAPARRPSPGWRTFALASGVAAAAAVVAFLALAPSSPAPAPAPASAERRSDELRFVVRVTAPEPAAAPEGRPLPPRLAAARHTGPLEVAAPRTSPAPGAAFPEGSLELVTEFGPSFAALPRKAVRGERLRITADRGEETPDGLVYEGDVLVELASFRIAARSVRVPAPGDATRAEEAPLLAREVRVEEVAGDCVAFAETLSFDPVSGSLVLTGVTRVETARGEWGRFAPGDRLVLSEGGFRVESAPVERHATPIPRAR